MKIELKDEVKALLDQIALHVAEDKNTKNDARIKNLEAVSAGFYRKIVYSIYAIMESVIIDGNHKIVKSLLLENEESLKSANVSSDISALTKLISEKLESHFKKSVNVSTEEMSSLALVVLLLIRVNERAPYVLPLDLEHYKALRSYVRKTIKPAGKIKRYNIESIDARSSIIQEIKRFNNEFYCAVKVNDLDELILDSKFKQYNFEFAIYNFKSEGEDENSKKEVASLKKEMISLREYIGRSNNNIRAKIHLEDGKIFLVTNREKLEIIIQAFTRKVALN